MVSDISPRTINAAQARSLREQALRLLERLTEDQQHSERRTAASGKRDAMRVITGRTAMEAAVEQARDLVRRMDLLLAEIEPFAARPQPAAVPAPAALPAAGPRPAVRPVRPGKVMPVPTTVPVSIPGFAPGLVPAMAFRSSTIAASL